MFSPGSRIVHNSGYILDFYTHVWHVSPSQTALLKG